MSIWQVNRLKCLQESFYHCHIRHQWRTYPLSNHPLETLFSGCSSTLNVAQKYDTNSYMIVISRILSRFSCIFTVFLRYSLRSILLCTKRDGPAVSIRVVRRRPLGSNDILIIFHKSRPGDIYKLRFLFETCKTSFDI